MELKSNVNMGWDVHAYTAQYNQFMQQEGIQFASPIEADEWVVLVKQLRDQYSQKPIAIVAIDKMHGRYNPVNKGYFDADLQTSRGPCNVARLLFDTWTLVKSKNDQSVFSGFGEMLEDIGSNCVQGDSHRLLGYYIGLVEYHAQPDVVKSREGMPSQAAQVAQVAQVVKQPVEQDAQIAKQPMKQSVEQPAVVQPKPVAKKPFMTDDELLAMRPPIPKHLSKLREEARLRRKQVSKQQ